MFRSIVLTGFCLLIPVTAARPGAMAPNPMPRRIAQADVVVMGTVVKIEAKTLKAERYPGDKQMAEHNIAVVKIMENICGAKGLTQIRVAFLPPRQIPTSGPTGSTRTIGTPLQVGMPFMIFAKRHPKESCVMANGYQSITRLPKMKANQSYLVKAAKQWGKIKQDTMKYLRSENAQERLEAATLLLYQYRWPMGRTTGQVKLSAKESKLILNAVLKADWSVQPRGINTATPVTTFNLLGITTKDGWQRPRDYKMFPQAARAWLTKNLDSFRITKMVTDLDKTK